jgi:transposase
MDTSGERPRKRWPEALKREIVAATMRPGASVSVVARQYDVNANQVFSWRRRYGGQSDPSPSSPSSSSSSGLVPVTVSTEPESEASGSSASMTSDMIEIAVSDIYRVKVGASFDARALKRVLDVLRTR